MTQQALQGACRFCGAMSSPETQAVHIVEEVAREHRIPAQDIFGKGRQRHLVDARSCAIRRIREETNLPLTAIGKLFVMDHSTVLHHLGRNGKAAAAEPSGGDRV